jgi:hypothetical protein
VLLALFKLVPKGGCLSSGGVVVWTVLVLVGRLDGSSASALPAKVDAGVVCLLL